MKVSEFLQENFPELRGRITGGNYPLPPLVELMLNMLSVLQLGGLMWMVVGGDKILNWIGMVRFDQQNRPILPGFYYRIQENTIQVRWADHSLAQPPDKQQSSPSARTAVFS